jgi:hypothetical protein
MFLRSIAFALALPAFIACSSDGKSATPESKTPDAATAGTAKIGDPCPNGVSDCEKGLGCDGDDPHGGQCFGICAPHQDSDCGDTTKFACNDEGHCYLRCNTNTDCPRYSEGYVCKDDTPVRAGIKFCDVPD